MGIFLSRQDDTEIYKDAYEEAQRIIRVSDEVRISLEKVAKEPEQRQEVEESTNEGKLSTSKLARKLGMKTADLNEKLLAAGCLEIKDGKHYITAKGKEAGGKFRTSSRFGPYFLWPDSFKP